MLKFNDKTPRRIKFNGNNLQELVYNGVTVYLRRLYKSVGSFPITLEKSWDENMEDYKIYGESIQDGVPTPETPIEVESVGEKTKNLFDKNTMLRNGAFVSGNTVVSDTEYIQTETTKYRVIRIPNLKAGTYTITVRFNNNLNVYWLRYLIVEELIPITTDRESFKFTTTQDGLVAFNFRTTTSENFSDNDYTVQLEKGSIATDYEPYGYKVPVKVSSKNKWDKENEFIAPLNVMKDSVILDPSKTYTVSFDVSPDYTYNTRTFLVSLRKAGYGKRNLWTDEMIPGARCIDVFTDMDLVRFNISSQTLAAGMISNIQIEEGNSATSYTPYFEPHTENIYLDEPLHKIDDYADYIDFKNKKVVRNVGEYIGNATEWNTSGSGTISKRYSTITGYFGTFNNPIAPLCNIFKGIKTSISNDVTYVCNIQPNGTGFIRIGINEDKNIINNMIMYYPLTTPTEESIELPDIPLQQGDNIISVETKIQPSKGELEYWRGL